MNCILMLIIVLVNSSIAYCQERSEIQNMYEIAIRNHLTKLKEINMDIDKIYFMSQGVDVEVIPKTIDEYTIKYLDLDNKENNRKLKERVQTIFIRPFILEKNKVTIRIYDSSVIYEKKQYHISSAFGSETVFEYSCGENRWMLLNSE